MKRLVVFVFTVIIGLSFSTVAMAQEKKGKNGERGSDFSYLKETSLAFRGRFWGIIFSAMWDQEEVDPSWKGGGYDGREKGG